MRSHSALYVDVGYLLASAATRVTGTSLRNGVVVDYGRLVAGLIAQVESHSGLPLLRVNWYDSGARPGGQADATQETVGLLPRVKLRLGRLSYTGEQKGVDVRLGLDLATHGRNRVVDVVYLVSGDDDLTEAVEEAQGHGVQVVILAVPDGTGRPHAVSRHLHREADDLVLITDATIDEAVHKPVPRPQAAPAGGGPGVVPAPPATSHVDGDPTPARGAERMTPSPADLVRSRPRDHAPAPPRSGAALAWTTTTGEARPDAGGAQVADAQHAPIHEVCRKVLTTWRQTATDAMVASLHEGRPHIPSDIDRALLVDLSTTIGVYGIDEWTRYELRRHFWVVLDQAGV